MTDSVTLWIAVLGVILGAASLTWHIVAFLMMGGRVKVFGSDGMQLVDSGRGTSTPVITLTVRNVGRMPVSVGTVWLRVPRTDIHLFVPNKPDIGPSMPRTIEPGHAEAWNLDKVATTQSLRRRFPDEREISLRPLIVLGNGRKKKGRSFKLNLNEALDHAD